MVIMAFWATAVVVVLIWLRAPLLICQVPPTKDQAELGVLELNVSWNRTVLLLTVTVTVLMAGIPRASVTVNWAVYVPALAYV